MIVVSDTSPISALLTINQSDVLPRLFSEVSIPIAVHRELLRAHPDIPEWIRVRAVQNLTAVAEFRAIVDPGEAEAIQLAKEIHADQLLIDDAKGRRCAEREGLAAIGLIGVILLAKTKGLIPAVEPVFQQLKRDAHIRISEEILRAAIQVANE